MARLCIKIGRKKLTMRKKKTTFIKWLDNGQFHGSICFCYGLTQKEIVAKLKKEGQKNWAGALELQELNIEGSGRFALRRRYEEKLYFFIILVEQFKFTDYEYCMLAHEITHICQFMLPDYLDRDREIECEAYFHTHVMRQCLEKIREATKKRK